LTIDIRSKYISHLAVDPLLELDPADFDIFPATYIERRRLRRDS